MSGIKITEVRISNFRSLGNVSVPLHDITVLLGANNSGKTSFLDALYAAIGAGRRPVGQDDIRLIEDEAFPPKDRFAIIDVRVVPWSSAANSREDHFPVGSYWIELWGSGISQEGDDFHDFMAFRTTLGWNPAKGDYSLERRFLKEWRPFEDWLNTPVHDTRMLATQAEPIAMHYIDAQRDLDEDLRKQGTFWRRMTDELGLSEEDVAALEESLTDLNKTLVDKSTVLQHLKKNLGDIQTLVSSDCASVEIAPVPRKLRDLSKGVDVSIATTGSQSFPLVRHGMGTRSLASLLVFRAYADWRNREAEKTGSPIHTVLGLEEPEAHLHPQAQRSLFAHIRRNIPGQRIVSTHSPYFAGQAALDDLRLFLKQSGETSVTALDSSVLHKDDVRKLEDSVVASRGDLLFAQAIVFFEGQTEEQALPIWAETYWGASVHELGFSFVPTGSASNYFPFIWLAEALHIPWYILADGEDHPVGELESALKKAHLADLAHSPNIVVIPNKGNFERVLVAEGYLKEIEAAMDSFHQTAHWLDGFIEMNHGKPYPKKAGNRDYKSEGGRERAAVDAMRGLKTRLAAPLAHTIAGLQEARRFPSPIRKLFEMISVRHGLEQAKEKAGE